MPGSPTTAQILDVPGARLYYERRGAGPLLLLIGSPMDSTGFAGLASALASPAKSVLSIGEPISSSSGPVPRRS